MADLMRTSRVSGSDSASLKQGLEAAAAKAVSLLPQQIQDDSLFLLCEWNPYTASLQLVVTDASKTRDSAEPVQVQFPDLASASPDPALAEQVKFLLSDFLASYSPFFRFSLVAIFHSSTRDQTCLL